MKLKKTWRGVGFIASTDHKLSFERVPLRHMPSVNSINMRKVKHLLESPSLCVFLRVLSCARGSHVQRALEQRLLLRHQFPELFDVERK